MRRRAAIILLLLGLQVMAVPPVLGDTHMPYTARF